MKRLFEFLLSGTLLIILSPLLIICSILVWLQDFHSPFYLAPRVGIGMRIFKMVKLRSMLVNAEKSGVDSTAGDDARITKIGKFIRKFKLDELTQLWNVLWGQMSFVGPRPNVQREVDQYTEEECKLLLKKPGITDFSSIVFSDEGDVLEGSDDPDLLYNQIIRPWKSRLSLFYIEKSSLLLDIQLIILTILAIFSRQKALNGVHVLLEKLGAENSLILVALRNESLQPFPPPGSQNIVENRN
jgi:lipopolysaccharide/colanic/teichoic acid biosynthesis glycosyltransferase